MFQKLKGLLASKTWTPPSGPPMDNAWPSASEGGKASIVMVNVSDGSIVAKISGRGDRKDPDW